MAPSVLEEYKPSTSKAKSPRKLGTTPMRHHVSPFMQALHNNSRQFPILQSTNGTEETMDIGDIPLHQP